jgi:hypothetical protein
MNSFFGSLRFDQFLPSELITDARKLLYFSKINRINSKNMASVQKNLDPAAAPAPQPSQQGKMTFEVEYMTQKAREISDIAKRNLFEEVHNKPYPDGKEIDRDQFRPQSKPRFVLPCRAEPTLFILDEIDDPDLGHKRTSEAFRIPQTPPAKRSKKFHHFDKENINPRIGSPKAPQSSQSEVKIQQKAAQWSDDCRYSLLDLWA